MIVTRTILLWSLWISLLGGFCCAQARHKSIKAQVRCPDEIAAIGYYRNYSYGFSVSIPRGLKGFWNSTPCVKEKQDCVCMGDHGRFIPIEGNSYLQVFVGVQTSETIRESIDEEVGFVLGTHEEKKERPEVVSRAPSRLGGISGRRIKFKYQDARTGEAMLEDIILSPPPVDRYHGGFLYSVTLSTPEKQYAKRKALFYSIVRSWRFRSTP
jgi:hypothetical protein